MAGTVPHLLYTPRSHVYGTDTVYYGVCGTGCGGIGLSDGMIFIDIRPAPARSKPTLMASASNAPALLGLDSHRYRIEKSADLSAWVPAGEVVGNYSEVDLSSFLAPDVRAQFFRATDVTGQ